MSRSHRLGVAPFLTWAEERGREVLPFRLQCLKRAELREEQPVRDVRTTEATGASTKPAGAAPAAAAAAAPRSATAGNCAAHAHPQIQRSHTGYASTNRGDFDVWVLEGATGHTLIELVDPHGRAHRMGPGSAVYLVRALDRAIGLLDSARARPSADSPRPDGLRRPGEPPASWLRMRARWGG